MANQNFCATHWGSREPQSIQPETEMLEGATCGVCGVPAARASLFAEPEPVPRGQLADGDRDLAVSVPPPAKLPSLRPSKAPPKG